MTTKKEVTYNTIGNIVSLFFQWVIILIIPKIHGFGDAGIFTVAVSVASILYFIASLALRDHQVSDQNGKFSFTDYRAVRIITILFSFICIIVVQIIFSYTVEQLLCIIGYVLYRNILNYAYLYAASLQIESKLDYVGKFTALEGIVSFTVFCVAYFVSASLSVSIFLMALIGGGSYLIALKKGFEEYVPEDTRRRKSLKPHIKILLLIGIPLMFSSLVPTIINALPKLLLQNLYGNELAGIYGTISAPIIVIPTIISSIFSPYIIHFSNIVKEGDFHKFRRSFMKSIMVILGFGLLLTFLAVLFEKSAFQLLYGHEVDEYIHYFAPLVVGITFYSIGMVSTIALVTKNQWRQSAYSCLIALLMSIPINYLMILDSGFSGATDAFIISFLVYAVLLSFTSYVIPLTKNNYDPKK